VSGGVILSEAKDLRKRPFGLEAQGDRKRPFADPSGYRPQGFG